jgi:hypothetical protein
MSKPSIFWNTWYIQYDYQPSKKHTLYTCGYVVLNAVNKRHARKILFKMLPKDRKKGLSDIKIESYPFTPYHNIPDLECGNYERKIKEFWSEQDYICTPLLIN